MIFTTETTDINLFSGIFFFFPFLSKFVNALEQLSLTDGQDHFF